MSISNLDVLRMFGIVKRQLNLVATAALKPLGIGPKQAVVIRTLQRLKSASLVRISEETFSDPTAVGRLIDGLVKRGLVLRVDDPADRRRWQVRLSKKGELFAEEVAAAFESVADIFAGDFTNAQRTEMVTLLTQVSERLVVK